MTRRPVHAAGMVVAETSVPEGQTVTSADLHTSAWTARRAAAVEAAVNARLTEQWPAHQAQLDAERLGHAVAANAHRRLNPDRSLDGD